MTPEIELKSCQTHQKSIQNGAKSIKHEVSEPSWDKLGTDMPKIKAHLIQNSRFGLHFGVQNPSTITMFCSRFLEVFSDCIFDDFGRLLDLILEVFGMPNGP